MSRTLVGVGIAAVLCVGCKKAANETPWMGKELATQHHAILDVEFDIKVPKGMKPVEVKPPAGMKIDLPPDPPSAAAHEVRWTGFAAHEVRWTGVAAGDVIDITVQLATPTAMQNAINFEGQTGRRTSRTDQAADGWTVTSYGKDGDFLQSRRLISKDRRGLFCNASVWWNETPGHDPKRNEWIESICASLVPTKFN